MKFSYAEHDPTNSIGSEKHVFWNCPNAVACDPPAKGC
jgi:hypothetical protein